MTFTIDKLPKCKVLIRFELPRDTVEKERAELLNQFAKDASLPGFRPGKTPRKLIEKRFQKEIDEDLNMALMRKGLLEITEQEKLEILDLGSPSESQINSDGTFTYSTEILIAPDLTLPEYIGIPIKLPHGEITSEEIESILESMRVRHAIYLDVEEGTADEDHVCIVDYTAQHDGKHLGETFPEVHASFAQATSFPIFRDRDEFFSPLWEHLVEEKIGTERDISITMAEDFYVPEMQGKQIDFHVKLVGMKRRLLPELNDKFASDQFGLESLDSLKAVIQINLQEQLRAKIQNSKEAQVLNFLNMNTDCELPEKILESETQRRFHDIIASERERGVEEDELIENQEKIIQSAQSMAARDLRSCFILEKIADEMAVVVTDRELNKEIEKLAKKANMSSKNLAQRLQRSGRVNRIKNNLRLDKTLEILIENAIIEEVSEENHESTDTPLIEQS